MCLTNSYNVLGTVVDIKDTEIKDTVLAHEKCKGQWGKTGKGIINWNIVGVLAKRAVI